MPQTVNILNWNVQNYGPRKSGLADLVQAVAQVTIASQADILVLLELNTTNGSTAGAVCRSLMTQLQWLSGGQFQTCVLSPNTGLEYYAFFVRDTAFTTPMVANEIGGARPVYLGSRGTAVRSATFSPYTNPYALTGGFPLLSPDLLFRARSVANWTGTRYPVFGLFRLPNAQPANQYLPLIACHFAANGMQAANQIENLKYFSPIYYTSPHANQPWPDAPPPPPGTLPGPQPMPQVSVQGAYRPLNYSVVCGDFNVDYPSWAYDDVIAGTFAPEYSLGGYMANQDRKTHLTTVKEFDTARGQDPNAYPTTTSLAIQNYDNFMLFQSPLGGAPLAGGVVQTTDVPDSVGSRTIRLQESVAYYVQLDQRGLTPTDALVQFCFDANAAPLPMSMRSALVGGRLVSDHLPVRLTLTVN